MARWRVYFTHKLCPSIPAVIRVARKGLRASSRAPYKRATLADVNSDAAAAVQQILQACARVRDSRRQTRRARNLHLRRSPPRRMSPRCCYSQPITSFCLPTRAPLSLSLPLSLSDFYPPHGAIKAFFLIIQRFLMLNERAPRRGADATRKESSSRTVSHLSLHR